MKSLFNWVVCLKIPIRAHLFYGKEEHWMKLYGQFFFKSDRWYYIKIRERKGPSRGVTEKCEPHDRSPGAPRFEERTRDETLQQERCARRAAWTWRRMSCW